MNTQIDLIPRKNFLCKAIAMIGSLAVQTGGTSVHAVAPQPSSSATEKFADRILSDTAAAMLSLGAYIGDRLGLYQIMAETGSATVSLLASKANLNERYLEEWLALMTTSGYVLYDPRTEKYLLPREHATVLCDQNSPYYMGALSSCWRARFPSTRFSKASAEAKDRPEKITLPSTGRESKNRRRQATGTF